MSARGHTTNWASASLGAEQTRPGQAFQMKACPLSTPQQTAHISQGASQSPCSLVLAAIRLGLRPATATKAAMSNINSPRLALQWSGQPGESITCFH